MKLRAFSVVIPAHNEATVIGRCLGGFLPDLEPDEAEVVVVANGCTDSTARQAAAYGQVTVIDLPEPGKAGALNAGDQAVTAFPRIYLDADIVVSASALRTLASSLAGPESLVGAPTAVFVTTGRPWAIQAFYRIYTRLPYVTDGLIGSGIYALSSSGRARFSQFPSATADDLFVQRHFDMHERVIDTTSSFVIETPTTMRGLLAVRTRTAYGNSELAATPGQTADLASTTGSSLRALLAIVGKDVRLLPSAIVYAAITFVARARARSRDGSQWDRDSSTR